MVGGKKQDVPLMGNNQKKKQRSRKVGFFYHAAKKDKRREAPLEGPRGWGVELLLAPSLLCLARVLEEERRRKSWVLFVL